MARPAKYSEDDLLVAVYEYSKTHPGKIIVSKLAAWASANIPSLSGVKANDFQRPRRNKNAEKTDKNKTFGSKPRSAPQKSAVKPRKKR